METLWEEEMEIKRRRWKMTCRADSCTSDGGAQQKQDKRNDEGGEKAETASDDNEPQLARQRPGRPPRRGRFPDK